MACNMNSDAVRDVTSMEGDRNPEGPLCDGLPVLFQGDKRQAIAIPCGYGREVRCVWCMAVLSEAWISRLLGGEWWKCVRHPRGYIGRSHYFQGTEVVLPGHGVALRMATALTCRVSFVSLIGVVRARSA